MHRTSRFVLCGKVLGFMKIFFLFFFNEDIFSASIYNVEPLTIPKITDNRKPVNDSHTALAPPSLICLVIVIGFLLCSRFCFGTDEVNMLCASCSLGPGREVDSK